MAIYRKMFGACAVVMAAVDGMALRIGMMKPKAETLLDRVKGKTVGAYFDASWILLFEFNNANKGGAKELLSKISSSKRSVKFRIVVVGPDDKLVAEKLTRVGESNLCWRRLKKDTSNLEQKLINGAKVRMTSLPARTTARKTGKARARSLPTLLQKFYGKEENTFWFEDSENDTVTLTYENGFIYHDGMVGKIRRYRVPRQNYHYYIRHVDESGKPKSHDTLFNFKKEQKQEQLQALREWIREMFRPKWEARDYAAWIIQLHWRERQLAQKQKKTHASKKRSPK